MISPETGDKLLSELAWTLCHWRKMY